MKKLFYYLITFLSIFIILFIISYRNDNEEEYNISVMNEIRTYNNDYQEYTLVFEKENLNLNNIKLKLSLFNSNDNYIKKIYIKYPNKLEDYFKNKEFFSFYGKNINEKIDNLKDKYVNILKKNNMFSDIEGLSINNIIIERVTVISNIKNIEIFKYKYPNVEIIKK